MSNEMLKKPKERDFLSSFLLFLVLGLFVVQFVLGIHVSTMGKQVSQLSADLTKIENENQFLNAQVASDASLKNIASKAAELGMTRPAEILYTEVSSEAVTPWRKD